MLFEDSELLQRGVANTKDYFLQFKREEPDNVLGFGQHFQTSCDFRHVYDLIFTITLQRRWGKMLLLSPFLR